MPDISMDERSRRLAGSRKISAQRWWNSLTPEERQDCARLAIEDERVKEVAVQSVAHARHFRPDTVRTWATEKLAHALARSHIAIQELYADLARSWWRREHVRTLGERLQEALGVSLFEEQRGVEALRDLTPEKLVSAADYLTAEFSTDDLVRSLVAAAIVHPFLKPGVERWLEALAPRTAAVVEAARPSEVPRLDATDRVDEAFGFTTLDRVLIRAIEECRQEIAGALEQDALDDLLSEVVKLNGSQPRFHFHLGYRDSLFGHPPNVEVAAGLPERRLWYWTGFVAGLARRGDDARIEELYRSEPTLSDIARNRGPATAAARSVLEALRRRSRYDMVLAFLGEETVRWVPSLGKLVVDYAAELIRAGRPADALQLLDTVSAGLGDGAALLETSEEFAGELKRRRALCLRQLGRTDEARSLFDELTRSSDSRTRATAFCDLGIMEAGFRRLGELRLPSTRDDLSTLRDALARGEQRFRRALEIQADHAHANFCLGVLALAREQFADAVGHLERAVSYFSQSPTVYGQDGTLYLAQLYLGLAIFNSLQDSGKLGRACEEVAAGLRGGAKLPPWLLEHTVRSLALQAYDRIPDLLGTLLEHDRDSTLDAVRDPGIDCRSWGERVTAALQERAADRRRDSVQRADDLQALLPALIRAERADEARDVLEQLLEAAINGVRREEFCAVLEQSYVTAVWTGFDVLLAQLSLLESDGRYAEAAARLEAHVHRMLASSRTDWEDVEVALALFEGYGSAGKESLARLQPAIESRAPREVEPITATEPRTFHLKLLLVGGNEVQERMMPTVEAQLREKYGDRVRLDFLPTGWNASDIPAILQHFERKLPEVDGVAMLYLMRTTLARSLRRKCSKPWAGCGRKGQGAILNTIERLVPMAERFLSEHESGSRN
jgi:tetratricopeptide (TPR) repeat protein